MEIGTSIQLAHDDQDASPCGLLQLYKITPRSPGCMKFVGCSLNCPNSVKLIAWLVLESVVLLFCI